MKRLALLAAALVLAALVAGCADRSSPDPVSDPPCAFDGTGCVPGAVVAPKVDARETLDALRDFSESHPYRAARSPTLAAARDDLVQRLSVDGLEVVRQDFGNGGQNILAFKWGSDRENWIVAGAHYDITEGAVHGAYDDGSGTAMVVQLAKVYANVNTTRTLVFAAFDQEELGLVGSNAFLEALADGTFPHPGAVDGMVDLDMVGITWPHPASLVVWENSESLTAKVQELASAAGVPGDHLEFRASRAGSSDGLAFMQQGIATAYFWSDWDQFYLPGGVEAPYVTGYVGSYPWWHKADTYDTMLVSAGDEATLEAGFQTVLDVVSPLLAHMASPQWMPDPDDA